MMLAKLLLPALFVATGVSAGVYAMASNDSGTTVATGAPDTWIDAPVGDKIYAPGTIDVYAHATAHDDIRALELVVDNKVVATDSDLQRTEKLFAGTFEWKADVGTHQLRVRPVGGKGRASIIVVIEVAKGGVVVAPAPTTTTPGATTTSSSTTTTTKPGQVTTVPGPGVTVVPPSGGGTPPPNTVPPNTPPHTSPPTTPPAARAVIDSASTFSPALNNRLYVPACGYTMEVTAVVRNASSVRVQVEGTNTGGAMTRSGNTYTYTLRSGQFTSSDVGDHRVLVIASGGGANPTADAGLADIRGTCPKD